MATHTNEGDALSAHTIAFQCRKITSQQLVHGTSSHRAQAGKLKQDAYCVIERKMERIPDR